MKKIAFVVVRYGKDINGGAELHCKMLAERLTQAYHVEVLTTCIKSYTEKSNVYPEGNEVVNNVLVRRFKAQPVHIFKKKAPFFITSRKLRQFRKALYKFNLLKPIANIFPVWTYRKDDEIRTYKSNVFYSEALFSFIKQHQQDYDVFIPITIDYPEAYYTVTYAPKKSILIPTMHYEKTAFRPILTEIFTKAAYIGFNTEEEEKLAENIFGRHMSPHGIISVGFETAPASDWQQTKDKYQLPENYLLYVGRVDKFKLDKIFKYFLAYKKKYNDSNLKLVLVGGLYTDKVSHPDILYTGFVDEEEKTSIIQHATIIVNPSKYESLSLILLEALSMKKAMMVNRKCNVMREHFRKSQQAIALYSGKKDFITQLHTLETSENLRKEMGTKGAKYVKDNYEWNIIMKRLIKQIEYVISQNNHTSIKPNK